MFVIIERNQASHQPRLAVDEVYDTRKEAEEFAQDLRSELATSGRRERYSVHELTDEEIR